jgi:hypothetical protein
MSVPYYTKNESDFKLQKMRSLVELSADGIKPFTTLAIATDFYNANPPDSDAMFVINADTDSNNGYYTWYASTNNNRKDRSFINISLNGVESGETDVVTGDQVASAINERSKQVNYFINNKFPNPINHVTDNGALPSGMDSIFVFVPQNISYQQVTDEFEYVGKFLKLEFGNTASNFFFTIAVEKFKSSSLFRETNKLNINFEFLTNTDISFVYRIYYGELANASQIGQQSCNATSGVNVISARVTLPDVLDDERFLILRIFPNDNRDWTNRTFRFGRFNIFSGKLNDLLELPVYKKEDFNVAPSETVTTNDIRRINYFKSNRFIEDIKVETTNSINLGYTDQFYYFLPQSIHYEDALPNFGYEGRSLVLNTSGTAQGNFFFAIPVKNFMYDEVFLENRDLKFNLEVSLPVALNFNVKIYSGPYNSLTLLSSKDIVGDSGVNIINLSAVVPSVIDNGLEFVYVRFFVTASQWTNKSFKFGRLNIYSGDVTEVLDFPKLYDPISETFIKQKINDYRQHWLNGMKLVTLGDSITAQKKWQPELVRRIGLIWSSSETAPGGDGVAAMGVGGSTVTPYITGLSGQQAGDSIYHRADDVSDLNPDVIILLGGQNDSVQSMGGDISIGSASDAAYTGSEVTSNPPSFCAAYKGTLEKLITQNQLALIVAVTPLWSGDQNYTTKSAKVTAIHECCALYGVMVVDLFKDLNVNSINQASLHLDTVHPGDLLGVRMGGLISSRL